MSVRKGLVLDANILIRAALGRRVRSLVEAYEDTISFYSPDICFDDAREYIPGIFDTRARNPQIGLAVLDQIALLVQAVDRVLYRDFERVARERIAVRDVDDWPVVAVALMLNVPIWTEDRDFFGSGIATWTTDRGRIVPERPPWIESKFNRVMPRENASESTPDLFPPLPISLINKVGNYCNLLRDDGVSHGDHVEQLTYLLFLKMDYERTRPPYNKKSTVLEDHNWASLIELDRRPIERHHCL